jgi:hypothetical protein
MDAEENHKQVFLRAHSPLEIANGAISTFPPPPLGVEKWKTKTGFPLSHSLFVCLKTNQKGARRRSLRSPAFRLILRLENAVPNYPRRRFDRTIASEEGNGRERFD